MPTVNISLPSPVADWVEEKSRSGEYASASDYVADLVRLDRTSEEDVVAALIEGEQSGLSSRTMDEIIAGAKARLRNEAG